jgi:hypothetical protein
MSETDTPAFRRLILELALGPGDARFLRLAAEFARDFGLDLHGVYVEDEALHHLGGFPFAREIRLPTAEWRGLDAALIADDLHQHAEAARLRLRQLLTQMGLRGSFEVRRGDPVQCLAGVCSTTDIVVVAASSRGPDHARLRETAVAEPASVLVLPERLARRDGPVVVVAPAMTDASVALGHQFATRHHAPLLTLLPPAAAEAARHRGIPERTEVQGIADLATDDVLRALAPVRERLVMIAHEVAPRIGIAGASRLANAAMAPVLLL